VLRETLQQSRDVANALALPAQNPDLHRFLRHQHEVLRFGVPHPGVGQFSIGDPGSVLHRRLHLTLDEIRSRFLEPIFALEGDGGACWALLAPFTSVYVCCYVYDAVVVPADAVTILDLCLGRFLASRAFKRELYRSGHFYGFDEPRLIETLMFVSVEHAALAARYVNGDWCEIHRILPLIDRFVRAGGWTASVMGPFLTLCERAKAAYPVEVFADQILSVIGDGSEQLKDWQSAAIAARIAVLVQHFADNDAPMPLHVAQKFLRILDLLVDMGDRRSAALQLAEAFREIRAAG